MILEIIKIPAKNIFAFIIKSKKYFLYLLYCILINPILHGE